LRNFNPAYNSKRFQGVCDSVQSCVESFSWQDRRIPQVTQVDLTKKAPEHRDQIIKMELCSGAENHKYGLFVIKYRDGSQCRAMFVSGDVLWVQKNGENKIMLR